MEAIWLYIAIFLLSDWPEIKKLVFCNCVLSTSIFLKNQYELYSVNQSCLQPLFYGSWQSGDDPWKLEGCFFCFSFSVKNKPGQFSPIWCCSSIWGLKYYIQHWRCLTADLIYIYVNRIPKSVDQKYPWIYNVNGSVHVNLKANAFPQRSRWYIWLQYLWSSASWLDIMSSNSTQIEEMSLMLHRL